MSIAILIRCLVIYIMVYLYVSESCGKSPPTTPSDCWTGHTATQACCYYRMIYNNTGPGQAECQNVEPYQAISGVRNNAFFNCGNYIQLYPNSSTVQCGFNDPYSTTDCTQSSIGSSSCCMLTKINSYSINRTCFMTGSPNSRSYQNKIGDTLYTVDCSGNMVKFSYSFLLLFILLIVVY